MSFDPSSFGLPSHYSAYEQERIRQYILGDWEAADQKLPTYTKLVARYIESDGLPEEWLSKLIHQTMGKMLKGISRPRYEFWACLHFYLMKKYGDEIHLDRPNSDLEDLGSALSKITSPGDLGGGGDFALSKAPHVSIRLQLIENRKFAAISCIVRRPGKGEFPEPTFEGHHGVGVRSGDRLIAVLRSVATRQLMALDIHQGGFVVQHDRELIERLERLAEQHEHV